MQVSRIEVRAVTRRFGATLALRQVSSEFQAGTLTFLEGPNGAGKSTLLAIIGTVLQPTSGSVWYEPLGDDQQLARRHIGWVAHDSHCYRELSGRRNIELVGQIHGVARLPERVARVVARVGAEGFADRPVGTLSRGQRQRIALARALVHDPGVLLLDEPWTGLDFASVDRLEAVIREEVARGSLVIAVTHGPGTAERMGARRVRIEAGRVVESSAAAPVA
ncbi:MAG TPA: ABC transporter ATP-binding protein [Polyangiaceae bacterium]|nr:ABC transporter ATP-binding protein [Polyangiaceae bacterium]